MTLPERVPSPEVAEAWIRECLSLHPEGADLRVSGTCMEPALREGSRIRLRSPVGPIRVGDVVLLRTSAGLRLHRVVFQSGGELRTKGDRGLYLDPATSRSEVIARCVTREPRWKALLRAASSAVRLLARPWAPPKNPGRRGDAAHARLLP
ncbi:MAG: S24/S26 family peptidase [Vicinamibacteria bacterium]